MTIITCVRGGDFAIVRGFWAGYYSVQFILPNERDTLMREEMKQWMGILGTVGLVMLPAVAAGNPVDRIGEKLEDVRLQDLEGKAVQLLDYHTEEVLVICYTGLGCPISGRYSPRLEKLSSEFADDGVRFVGISANPHSGLEEIAKEMDELGVTFPVLKDADQALTRQLDAKTTTEVFVVDKDRVIRYRGMVDDQYAVGVQRAKPKYRYLERAVKSVLKGRLPHIQRTAAPGCLITRAKAPAKPSERVTYSAHIARIVQDNCQGCHRPKQIGPFPLTTYEEVSGWSAMIYNVLEEKRMPPWNADPEFDSVFVNQRSLSKGDKDLLMSWIVDGMPRGNPDADPAEKTWPKRWRIGKPDKTYSMRQQFVVPKEGVVEYQYFVIPTNFPEDKWIKAMECRSGAADVVHHILAFIQDPKKPVNNARLGLEDGYLCAQVPGDTPSIFPEGYAKRLPAGSNIILQLHYTTNGKQRRDRSSIGLVFADEPAEREVLTRGIYNLEFEIPAGAANHEVRSSHTFKKPVEIFALYPHMHFRGKDFTYVAHLPDGTERKLLSVSRYDYNWQEGYILKESIILPADTELECIAHFDNSDNNFANPDSTVPVHFGEQTWEEMMIGYMDYVYLDEDDKKVASAVGPGGS